MLLKKPRLETKVKVILLQIPRFLNKEKSFDYKP